MHLKAFDPESESFQKHQAPGAVHVFADAAAQAALVAVDEGLSPAAAACAASKRRANSAAERLKLPARRYKAHLRGLQNQVQNVHHTFKHPSTCRLCSCDLYLPVLVLLI